MPEGRCWVNVVSLDHVEAGVAGGFTQADHGKPDRLRRLSGAAAVVRTRPHH